MEKTNGTHRIKNMNNQITDNKKEFQNKLKTIIKTGLNYF